MTIFKNNKIGFCFFLVLGALAVSISCNETFQPLEDSNRAVFSMYGYLDASADTQWVRITPSRNQLDQPPVKPEMQVTLSNPDNGMSITMNDSLFQLREEFNVVNSWTTADIKPGETYELKAKRPDGAVSKVSVTIPQDFPEPKVFGFGCQATIRIGGVERLADVQSRWHLRISYANSDGRTTEERFFTIPIKNNVVSPTPENYTVSVNSYDDMDYIKNEISVPPGTEVNYNIISRDIFVAAGGPEWIEGINNLNEIEYALPEGVSNIENGLGYMMGVVSKSVSYIPPERCLYNDNSYYKKD